MSSSNLLRVIVCAFSVSCVIPSFAQQEEREFFSVYSRPNDDRFQNTTGATGEPYEVARIRVSVFAKSEQRRHRLRYRWAAEMTTGRHVEAASFFAAVETESNLRRTGTTKDLTVRYPKGVTEESPNDKKIGSVMFTEFDLGEITRDGEYAGVIEIRTKANISQQEIREGTAGTGVTQLVGRKTATFQFLRWKATVRNGELTKVEASAQRFAMPFMKLIESNCIDYDARAEEHKPYPAQAPAAKCKQETVGGVPEGVSEHKTQVQRLTEAMAKAVVASRCTDCHGEGNAANFRFCDDGTPIYPTEDAERIFSMMVNESAVDWKNYPRGMKDAVDAMKELEKQDGVVSAWAFKHGVSPGIEYAFPEGIACRYQIRFHNLDGAPALSQEVEEPVRGETLAEAVAEGCRACMRELFAHKARFLREDKFFLSYGCFIPREGCVSEKDGVGYSVGTRELQRALAELRDSDATTLCRLQ